MSAQHTPGLLVVRGYSIYTADGTPVADTCLTASHPDNDHANALRLAACWNAFDGLPTTQIESVVNVPEFFFKHMDLMDQHRELLAALDGLLNVLPSATTHPAIKAAKAARANATKEAP